MNKRRGFTLLEIIICLAIIVIVASFTYVSAKHLKKIGDAYAAKTGCSTVEVAANKYCYDAGYSRDKVSDVMTADVLTKTQVVNGEVRGPWLSRDAALDPWGKYYRYIINHGKIVAWSYGPDYVDGCSRGTVFFNSEGYVRSSLSLKGQTGDDIYSIKQ